MTLSAIGWIIFGAILSVVIIALVIARIMCPPEFYQPPKAVSYTHLTLPTKA